MDKRKYIHGLGLILLTFLIFLLSVFPTTKSFLYIFLYGSIVLLSVQIILQKYSSELFIYSLFALILFVVSLTGWFISPLFYLLYFGVIIMSFLYDPLISVLYIVVLSLIYIPNISTIDIKWDILHFISFFLVIPFTYFLRNEYVRLRENEKKILVLEKKHLISASVLEQLSNNKIFDITLAVREKINDVAQYSYLLNKTQDTEKAKKYRAKIQSLTKEALQIISEFEQKSTGFHLSLPPALRKKNK